MNISRWQKLRPFEGKYNVKKHVDLILYYHRDYHVSPQKSYIDQIKIQLEALQTFNRVLILSADLPVYDDKYPMGPSYMFFKLMLSTPLIEDSGYNFVFLMEPDCHPIRHGWLSQLYALTATAGPSWIIGSARRGEHILQNNYAYTKGHINGNAIYRVDHPGFRTFVEAVLDDFDQDMERYQSSFDLALSLFRSKLDPEWMQTDILHRFTYTGVILNFWRSQIHLSDILEKFPDAFIAHGRNISF